MTDTTSEKITDLSLRRLETAEAKIGQGFRAKASAYHEIREENLYELAGFETFKAYVTERAIDKVASAYRHARCHPLLEILPEDVAPLITGPDQLKPILGMKRRASDGKTWEPDHKRMIAVLQMAEQKATRINGRPTLSPELIADVAEEHFQWLRRLPSRDGKSEGQRKLEAHFAGILNCELTPQDAVREWGNAFDWRNYTLALDWMEQARGASQKGEIRRARERDE